MGLCTSHACNSGRFRADIQVPKGIRKSKFPTELETAVVPWALWGFCSKDKQTRSGVTILATVIDLRVEEKAKVLLRDGAVNIRGTKII